MFQKRAWCAVARQSESLPETRTPEVLASKRVSYQRRKGLSTLFSPTRRARSLHTPSKRLTAATWGREEELTTTTSPCQPPAQSFFCTALRQTGKDRRGEAKAASTTATANNTVRISRSQASRWIYFWPCFRPMPGAAPFARLGDAGLRDTPFSAITAQAVSGGWFHWPRRGVSHGPGEPLCSRLCFIFCIRRVCSRIECQPARNVSHWVGGAGRVARVRTVLAALQSKPRMHGRLRVSIRKLFWKP